VLSLLLLVIIVRTACVSGLRFSQMFGQGQTDSGFFGSRCIHFSTTCRTKEHGLAFLFGLGRACVAVVLFHAWRNEFKFLLWICVPSRVNREREQLVVDNSHEPAKIRKESIFVVCALEYGICWVHRWRGLTRTESFAHTDPP
jgi:hypothetical protein